ncbi:MAG TPA: TetR family transcriptional regulator [Actinocatenispora sp.]
MVGTASANGLRERKKQQTRGALITAAQRLFAAHGYEKTTTDQIAAAVDVSQRTLFRYFANKDEIALAPLDEVQDSFAAALRERPRRETPMTALRNAIRTVFAGYLDEKGVAGDRLAVLGATLDLVGRTPALQAANMRRSADREQQLAAILAEREGVDPDTDLRPRLAVATFDAVLRVGSMAWCEHGDLDPHGMYAELERAFEALPGIFGRWRTPAEEARRRPRPERIRPTG